MSGNRRDILEQVARGDLSPEEADELLRRADSQPPSRRPREEPVRSVKVTVGVGRLEVVGDPSVAVAEVEGPHSAEIVGDTFEVRGEWDGGEHGFAFSLGRRRHRVVFGEPFRSDNKLSSLTVRMNPELSLEAKLDAGPLSIRGVHAPIQARCAAGPITIDDFQEPLDVSVNAGAIRATGKLTHGESRLRSDAGAVRVELDPASSVHVVAQAALGKVALPGAPLTRSLGSDVQEATIGEGAATLRVETAMGSVRVSVR